MVKEGFVVTNKGFGDEGEAVKDVEDHVLEGALVVSFGGIPEFGKVIIRNCINEEDVEEFLHCEGHVMSFFVVLVHYFKFGTMAGCCSGWDIRIHAQVMGDDEVVAITGGEKFILHHESKMSFLSATAGAEDCQCILVGLLLKFLHAGVCRFAITQGEFWEWKMAMEGFNVNCVHGGGVSFGHQVDGLCLCLCLC